MSRDTSVGADIVEKLRMAVSYDPETGRMVWQHRSADSFAIRAGKSGVAMAKAFNRQFAGADAFARVTQHGYLQGSFLSRPMYAHQVAWAIHTGEWPDGSIDHINGTKTDNRLANLRLVDSQGNLRNAAMWSHNKSGTNGVYESKGRWCAFVMIDQKSRHLGTYDTKAEATAARRAANIVLGFTGRHGAPIAA